MMLKQRNETHMLAVFLLENCMCWRGITFLGPVFHQRPKFSNSFGISWPSQQAGVDADLDCGVSNLVENETLDDVGLEVTQFLFYVYRILCKCLLPYISQSARTFLWMVAIKSAVNPLAVSVVLSLNNVKLLPLPSAYLMLDHKLLKLLIRIRLVAYTSRVHALTCIAAVCPK